MMPGSQTTPNAANATVGTIRNPFGVIDVPDPDGEDVQAFAAATTLDGGANDDNATAWPDPAERHTGATLEGHWGSRWNGGADPTIPGDTPAAWKKGPADARLHRERLYILFEWDGGARRGLIEARGEGSRLTGKYVNLTDPSISRPWVGLIVSGERIDGRWTNGRLDFRR